MTIWGWRSGQSHVPKTIDNDLPLPEGIPTFGFETAREVGTKIVMNFMEDALTSQTWFVVVTMGRKAGHLALGIGKSSGATLTIIPEEWRGQPIRLQEVVDILVTSILRRLSEGRRHGVALVAEGILEYLAPEDRQYLQGIDALDPHGHVALHDMNFSDILKRWVIKDLADMGVKIPVRDKELGYELRCAPPIAYDVDYTRSLGEAAADFLLQGAATRTISLQGNQVVPIASETDHGPGDRPHRRAHGEHRLVHLPVGVQVHDPAEAGARPRTRCSLAAVGDADQHDGGEVQDRGTVTWSGSHPGRSSRRLMTDANTRLVVTSDGQPGRRGVASASATSRRTRWASSTMPPTSPGSRKAEARSRRAIGYPYSRMEQEGVSLAVAEVSARYHRPARYDDEVLVRAALTQLGSRGHDVQLRGAPCG